MSPTTISGSQDQSLGSKLGRFRHHRRLTQGTSKMRMMMTSQPFAVRSHEQPLCTAPCQMSGEMHIWQSAQVAVPRQKPDARTLLTVTIHVGEIKLAWGGTTLYPIMTCPGCGVTIVGLQTPDKHKKRI